MKRDVEKEMHAKKGSNVNSIKTDNRALLIRVIKEHDGISRADLAKVTSLSKGGITPIINELLKMGIIHETGTINTESGRKPIQLKINPSGCYAIVVDWTRKDITVALVDFTGNIISITVYKFLQEDSLDYIVNVIKSRIAEILNTYKDKRIIGIGVVAPGPLDYKSGTILSPPNFRGWSNIPIALMLEKEFNIPVFVDNNSNAHALAEKNFGLLRHYNHCIHIVVDEGIGAGIILNDNIFRGAMGFGSEIGHITINMKGPQCKCGNIGCLEVYATIPKLLEKANNVSCNIDDVRSTALEWEDIINGLKDGNEFYMGILKEEAQYLGNALVSLINLFDPQIIVIGSILAMAGEYITKPLKDFIENKIIARNFNLPGIYTSSLKQASLKGGATIVFEHFISGDMGIYEKII